jgi:hypothetical protein
MNTEVDHEYTNCIVCPYCGHQFKDSWEYGRGEGYLGEIACELCEESFHARRMITVTYTTSKD